MFVMGSSWVVNYVFSDVGLIFDVIQLCSIQFSVGLCGYFGDWQWDLWLDDQYNIGMDCVCGLLCISVFD